MMKLLPICIKLLLCASPLAAQERPEASTHLSIATLFPVSGPSMVISYGEKETKELPIKVANFRMMTPLKYKGPLTVNLLEQSGGTPVAKLKLNPNWKKTTVVIFPNRYGAKPKYNSLSFDASTKNFPAGGRIIFNLTNYPVKGEWGQLPFEEGDPLNKTFSIQSKETKVLKPIDPKAPLNESQPILMHYKKDNTWHAFVESRWFHDPKMRNYTFLYTTKKRNAVIIKSISERIQQ